METSETNSSSGYAKPPWLFKGSALYQFHLVKAATARAFIPKEFRLVEAFGYTLGGFFLAHYDDSPVGILDELVVIAGIVWNPPTSCAWAARVLVNNHEACFHGRKAVGLPSQVARFSKKITSTTEKHGDKNNGFLNMLGVGTILSNTKSHLDIEVAEVEDGSAEANFCNIKLQASVPQESSSANGWMGPRVKMSLPSFSGNTEYNPQLLKYSCQIECSVRPVKTAKISGPIPMAPDDEEKLSHQQSPNSIDGEFTSLAEKDSRKRSISVLLSKPLLALQFSFLKMQVDAPTVLDSHSRLK